MHAAIALLTLLLASFVAAPTAAEDGGVYEVVGRGVEGRPPYRGGGTLKFLDARIAAQVVHFGGGEMPLPLEIDYDVLDPAPILLTSRLGTEYWRLYHFAAGTMSAVYADEKIDLAAPGRKTARASKARFGASYGPLPQPGLVGIRGHYYFLVDQPDGK